MEVGLSPGNFMLHGDPAPLPKKGAEPPFQFSAHFYCGQMARCIKMPLGTEVNPGQATLCLMGSQLLPLKGVQSPILRPMSVLNLNLNDVDLHAPKS